VPETPVESNAYVDDPDRTAGEKALALPNPEKAPEGELAVLPATPRVSPIDLLRAADAALLAGELARARSLIAAAAAQLEAEKAAPVPKRSDSR